MLFTLKKLFERYSSRKARIHVKPEGPLFFLGGKKCARVIGRLPYQSNSDAVL